MRIYYHVRFMTATQLFHRWKFSRRVNAGGLWRHWEHKKNLLIINMLLQGMRDIIREELCLVRILLS